MHLSRVMSKDASRHLYFTSSITEKIRIPFSQNYFSKFRIKIRSKQTGEQRNSRNSYRISGIPLGRTNRVDVSSKKETKLLSQQPISIFFFSFSFLFFFPFSKYYPDENSRGAEVWNEEERHGSWIGTLLNNLVAKEEKRKEGRGAIVRRLKKTRGRGGAERRGQSSLFLEKRVKRGRKRRNRKEGREGERYRLRTMP